MAIIFAGGMGCEAVFPAAYEGRSRPSIAPSAPPAMLRQIMNTKSIRKNTTTAVATPSPVCSICASSG